MGDSETPSLLTAEPGPPPVANVRQAIEDAGHLEAEVGVGDGREPQVARHVDPQPHTQSPNPHRQLPHSPDPSRGELCESLLL